MKKWSQLEKTIGNDNQDLIELAKRNFGFDFVMKYRKLNDLILFRELGLGKDYRNLGEKCGNLNETYDESSVSLFLILTCTRERVWPKS
jgi:hypothetical protein